MSGQEEKQVVAELSRLLAPAHLPAWSAFDVTERAVAAALAEQDVPRLSGRRPARRALAAGAFLVALSVPATALAGRSGPGGFLYPLKLTLEQIAGWVAVSDSAELHHQLAVTGARLREADRAIEAGDEAAAAEAVRRAEAAIALAQGLLAAGDEHDAAEVALLVSRTEEERAAAAGREQREPPGDIPSGSEPETTGSPTTVPVGSTGSESQSTTPPTSILADSVKPPDGIPPGHQDGSPGATAPGLEDGLPSATAPGQQEGSPSATAPGQVNDPGSTIPDNDENPGATAPGPPPDSPGITAPSRVQDRSGSD